MPFQQRLCMEGNDHKTYVLYVQVVIAFSALMLLVRRQEGNDLSEQQADIQGGS